MSKKPNQRNEKACVACGVREDVPGGTTRLADWLQRWDLGGWCKLCREQWKRAMGPDSTIGQTVGALRIFGGVFIIDDVNYAREPAEEPEDFKKQSEAIDEALKKNNCTGQAKLAMNEEIRRVLKQAHAQARANSLPNNIPRPFKVNIRVTGCTVEASVDYQY